MAFVAKMFILTNAYMIVQNQVRFRRTGKGEGCSPSHVTNSNQQGLISSHVGCNTKYSMSEVLGDTVNKAPKEK